MALMEAELPEYMIDQAIAFHEILGNVAKSGTRRLSGAADATYAKRFFEA